MHFEIDGVNIGKNTPVFIIAELSCNHRGDLNIAKKSIEKAKEIGADAIKLQIATPDDLTLDSDRDHFRISGGTLWDGRRLYDLYQETYTPWEWYSELKALANEIGISLFASPFSTRAVDFLENHNSSAYKIASFEIADIPLIEKVARTQKPIIISTGIADLNDINLAIETCLKQGNNKVALLKCVSAYPTKIEEMNLLSLKTLSETYPVITGLSDHSIGSLSAIISVGLGAKVIEKHFILDKSLGGPDVEFSADANEFRQYIIDIRDAEKALGSHEVTISNKIKIQKENFGRKLFFVNNKGKGEKISEADIKSLRGAGASIHTKYYKDIVGATIAEDVQVGDPVIWENIIKKED
ncbi:MAG: pseudaminic acid synthase [Candidatus Marinamargulisbacteria bacterium]